MANNDGGDPKAAKKKRKGKKKNAGQKTPDGTDALAVEHEKAVDDVEDEQGAGEEDETTTPIPETNPEDKGSTDIQSSANPTETTHEVESTAREVNGDGIVLPIRNGETRPITAEPVKESDKSSETEKKSDTDSAARFDALAHERDALRAEVTELRRSLESLQSKHSEQLNTVSQDLSNANIAKDRAEEQYSALLGKVSTIRSQLGERLKSDAEELSRARSQISDMLDENKRLQQVSREKDDTIDKLHEERKAHNQELTAVRSRTNLSTNNWTKERDDLNSQLAYAREEFEDAKQAMQDWEVLALEERSRREALEERVISFDEQIATHQEAYERATDERDKQQNNAHGLQRALQDMQQARQTELREMVESTQTQLETLRRQVDEAVENATASTRENEATQSALQRALPFEKEVREKNLLIGKLRHEAVILNDHLTKALRFLKRGKPEDNVDRQVVTNHLLHFLALDRSDAKKFQVLKLIAALLGWTEEQREQAGLARPGASNAQLRIPLSPFRRTPSTPALSSEYANESMRSSSIGGRTSRESLAELWSDFLEREAEEGGTPGSDAGGSMRRKKSSVGNISGIAAPALFSPPEKGDAGLGIKASGPSNES